MKTFTKVCEEVLESYEMINRSESGNIFVGKTNARDLLDMAIRTYKAECAKSAQTFADDANPILAEQIWDIYAKAVGGKTFDGSPLPKFDKLGTQKTGWFEVADAVNAKLGFKLSKSETAPISALLRNGQASAAPISDKPELYANIKFEELYIFGLNAGKNQKGTLKFVNGFVEAQSLNKSSDILKFNYTSATTGEERFAVFMKSNISGYSYTQADDRNKRAD